jgi:succinate-semialdehyde dehydrogenase/glutarate-semialdehyde dehydrogenase
LENGVTEQELLKQAGFIDGAWVAADSGATFAVTNPATGETIATVPDMGAAETKRAIDAAAAALPGWAALTAKERAAILRKWFDLLMAHQEPLARILTAEQGKSLAEARGEIAYGASFIEWFAEEAKRLYGDVIPGHQRDKRLIVLKQPIGVVGAITPWNFPCAMITRKLGPALAAGCTAVVKPAEATPLTALAMAVLAVEAGIPRGVVNLVTGDAKAIGGELTANPLVRKISFTGSTEVGRLLLRQSADTVKKCSMELGGNAPFIVFDDADVDAAVEGALASKYRNSGQTCVSVNRIYAQAGIYDAFVAKLAERSAALRVGDGMAAGTELGPLIDDKAVRKVEDHIADAVAQGARLLTGGKRHPLGHSFFEPTVLADVTQAMKITREETFGPVAAVVKFADEGEAVAMANASEFGLAAYFYARDIGRVWRVAEAIESGMIGINTGILSTEVAPFGGVKQSGLGREGSRYGIDDYVETKYLCMSV